MRHHRTLAISIIAVALMAAGCGGNPKVQSGGSAAGASASSSVPSPTTGRLPVTLGPPTVITIGSCHLVDGKADHRCTPGAINPLVLQDEPNHYQNTICSLTPKGQDSWIRRQRPPTSYTNALKAIQIPEYGLGGRPPTQAEMDAVDEDHWFAIEDGGAPRDANNLMPEPKTGPRGAYVKDGDERRIHNDICAGHMTVQEAFQFFVDNWSHD